MKKQEGWPMMVLTKNYTPKSLRPPGPIRALSHDFEY